MSDDINEEHRKKMVKLKEEQRAKVKEKKKAERGLLMVHTGDGKGKSTAAYGTLLRALGWGHDVAVLQYVKGNWKTGEKEFFKRFPELVRLEVMGEGFTWETQDRERDIEAARKAWEVSKEMLNSGDYDLVVLDELNIVLRNDYLDVKEVKEGLLARHPRTTVIVTGRNAKQEIMDVADLVTSMEMVRHPFENGIKAARGIDF
ncbi:cob(I)yrinic acid a,c-diamide adenosyltransferase [Kordiimonas sp. SCSIO 12603]|uniref:cob(I)yrinic acid a,c-diamide adenosyltransferase n=1 Tax=Kordiimonas sp. SCSIO 12603 TaxID=2829596 RepID=UPI002101E373|nr:cob(I)yrinic acid a,c-diamide adenosyltransferase [Kordiimonas sp. SCSIO 12603]UTW57417.1 cob(I)yrinic acid a,c-diamide adenosyltransferase [Kordiimonas sp. SCSIO 12603]